MKYSAVIERFNIHSDEIRRDYSNTIKRWNPKRAEFINVQLDMRIPNIADDSWLLLHERSRDLLIENGKKWVPKRLIDYKPTFYRGFVEGIDLNADLFLNRVKEIYRLAPIRHLCLRKTKTVAKEVFNSPHLSEIVSLTFSKNREENDKLTDKELEFLTKSPYLQKLSMLELRWNQISPEGLEMLAKSDNLPNLRYVGISGNFNIIDGFEEVEYDNSKLISVKSTKLAKKLALIGNKPKLWLSRVSRGESIVPHPNDF
jgi:hypothetical protein